MSRRRGFTRAVCHTKFSMRLVCCFVCANRRHCGWIKSLKVNLWRRTCEWLVRARFTAGRESVAPCGKEYGGRRRRPCWKCQQKTLFQIFVQSVLRESVYVFAETSRQPRGAGAALQITRNWQIPREGQTCIPKTGSCCLTILSPLFVPLSAQYSKTQAVQRCDAFVKLSVLG